jgi:hypothetical protein
MTSEQRGHGQPAAFLRLARLHIQGKGFDDCRRETRGCERSGPFDLKPRAGRGLLLYLASSGLDSFPVRMAKAGGKLNNTEGEKTLLRSDLCRSSALLRTADGQRDATLAASTGVVPLRGKGARQRAVLAGAPALLERTGLPRHRCTQRLILCSR